MINEDNPQKTFNDRAVIGLTPTRQTSVNFSARLHAMARENNINLRKALEFGIEFKLAEIIGGNYPQNLLSEKISKLAFLLEKQMKEEEKEDLKEKDKEITDEDIDKILTN